MYKRQDRLRAILPDGFESLRPVLRINGEIRDGETGYIEFNTAVAADGIRGWLNIGAWDSVHFEKAGNTVKFQTEELDISFTGVGVEGSCPAERDNEGCFFIDEKTEKTELRPPEIISANKEFCLSLIHSYRCDGLRLSRASVRDAGRQIQRRGGKRTYPVF